MKKQTFFKRQDNLCNYVFTYTFLWIVTAFVFVCIFAIPYFSEAYTSPGSPIGFVNDFAGILTTEEKNSLETQLNDFAISTTNEIVVVTIISLHGESIESFAEKLFQDYGIGKAKKDNGILLLIAPIDQKIRIEVGYGLEGALTDIVAGQIIRDEITPYFSKNNYFEGISKSVNSIIQATKNEYVVAEPSFLDNIKNMIPNFIFIFVIIFFQFVVSFLARSKEWYTGGIIGGGLGIIANKNGMLGDSVIVSTVVTVFLIIIGLAFDYVVSKYNKIHSSQSYEFENSNEVGYVSRSSSSRSSGSRSNSSSRFGGGSSGGGGASGRW